ncbi:hypothetical protein GGR54DRAFT_602534 [Hypoxylon sp. NC1633]|nr:hypothetical protein GGR54DRAFT_602534 [Hypoxylon sp. NC1633]
MQQELPNVSNQIQQDNPSQSPQSIQQHGLQHHDQSGPTHRSLPRQPSGDLSPRSDPGHSQAGSYVDDEDADSFQERLDERLRRLNVEERTCQVFGEDRDASDPEASDPKVPGQRIDEYEKALMLVIPRQALQALGFKAQSRSIQLSDFPNEILTHILSHMHPDSHASVALVSKRFYGLVTNPQVWYMAFHRFFPGQDAQITAGKSRGEVQILDDWKSHKSLAFTRLSPHGLWRSEYLLRIRLLRSVAKGKPGRKLGRFGASAKVGPSYMKATAVLTYNSKLLSPITNIHAIFEHTSKKPPRVIHGASRMGVASTSDPTTGKLDIWGLTLERNLENPLRPSVLYGLGNLRATVPNVVDVSQAYGLAGGEGFPGGRVYYHAANKNIGRFLTQGSEFADSHPDIPEIRRRDEATCSVWIAKSASILYLTQSIFGIMIGSSLGVVTTYAVDRSPLYEQGEMTARWVLSPGVPIIGLRVDDRYNLKRNALGRVWAVALNALGEVYYLTQPPTAPLRKTKTDDSVLWAWRTARSTCWQLVEATRRQAQLHAWDDDVPSSYSPRSSSDNMNLTEAQMAAEAKEIEKFSRYLPFRFREVCSGWDMRRKLEVDFASDDEHGAGECVFVIGCGHEDDQTSTIRRFHRTVTSQVERISGSEPPSPNSSGPSNAILPGRLGLDDWAETPFCSVELLSAEITATAVDLSHFALITSFEDTLKEAATLASSIPARPARPSLLDVPGRRARLLGVGTKDGKILLWNMREAWIAREVHAPGVQPVRIIQTKSPEISCMALSALYLVHGGSDGLVQAWDPLASTLDPIQTIKPPSTTRLSSTFRIAEHWGTGDWVPASGDVGITIGAIYLDPDPTALRGIVAFGAWLRYWSYSSLISGPTRRPRRSRNHGRVMGRLEDIEGYIATEAEEMRSEEQHKASKQARLRSRFGVGLADLTEEETIRYAEMMSQESFLLDEQRRASASDTGSAGDLDTTSTFGSTVTPDPSVTGPNPLATSSNAYNETADESEYELQIQAAIRLSLLEGVNGTERLPQAGSSAEYDVPIVIKKKKGKRPSSSSLSSSHTPIVKRADPSSPVTDSFKSVADDDLEFALQLSLAEEESRRAGMPPSGNSEDEISSLGSSGVGKEKGKGKGKGRAI